MQLKNNLPHMRGKKVKVGDTSYNISVEGIVDVSEEHAALMLQNPAWQRFVARAPATTVIEKPVEVQKAEPIKAEIDFSKMKKTELVKLLRYKKIPFSQTMKKGELIKLLERGN